MRALSTSSRASCRSCSVAVVMDGMFSSVTDVSFEAAPGGNQAESVAPDFGQSPRCEGAPVAVVKTHPGEALLRSPLRLQTHVHEG